MKKTWIFFVLAPLFSYAENQEEWLSEITFPEELVQETPQKNKEISYKEEPSSLTRAQQRRAQRKAEAPPREKNEHRRTYSRPPAKELQSDSNKSNESNQSRFARKEAPKDPSKESSKKSPKESRWAAFLERLTLKKETTKSPGGLNIVTNRKQRTYPELDEEQVQESQDAELAQEEKQEAARSEESFSKQREYRYKARERIGAEGMKREREMSAKRKNELLKKSDCRARKNTD